MTRGQVLEMQHCAICNRPSMRVWPVKYFGKDITMCQNCIDEAAGRGGYIKVATMGDPTTYLHGPDIAQIQGDDPE